MSGTALVAQVPSPCPAVLSWPEVVFAGWAGLRGSVSLIMIADFLTHRSVAAAWACNVACLAGWAASHVSNDCAIQPRLRSESSLPAALSGPPLLHRQPWRPSPTIVNRCPTPRSAAPCTSPSLQHPVAEQPLQRAAAGGERGDYAVDGGICAADAGHQRPHAGTPGPLAGPEPGGKGARPRPSARQARPLQLHSGFHRGAAAAGGGAAARWGTGGGLTQRMQRRAALRALLQGALLSGRFAACRCPCSAIPASVLRGRYIESPAPLCPSLF